jgi:DNA-binding MarR family transcriptional regulator
VAGKPDDRRIGAWRALLATHAALVDRLGEELQDERDLPLPWYEVLLFLNRAPEGRLRMGELAGSLILTPSGATRLVDRMEDEGLVERQRCPSDRRGWLAVITPAGRARLKAASPVHLRGVEEHFGRHLSDEDADLLASILGRVLIDLRPDTAERIGVPGTAC